MRFIAFVAALLVFPSLVFGACKRQDWRAQLAPETMPNIQTRLAHVPFHRGVAFEAVRGESRLTLFGTVHVYDPGVHVPNAIATRIRSADLVLVEAPPEILTSFRRRLVEDYTLSFDVAGPEGRDRVMVRVAVGGHKAHPEVATGRALDPTAREDPVGIAVDQKCQHHPRVVLRRTAAATVHLEGAKLDALDRLDHEVRQIVLRDPIPKIGRKQESLVPPAIHESAHGQLDEKSSRYSRKTATNARDSRSAGGAGFSPAPPTREPRAQGAGSQRFFQVFFAKPLLWEGGKQCAIP